MSATTRIRHRAEFDKVVEYLRGVPRGKAYLSEGCLDDVIPANNPKERKQWSERLAILGKTHGLCFTRELKSTSGERNYYHYAVTKV